MRKVLLALLSGALVMSGGAVYSAKNAPAKKPAAKKPAPKKPVAKAKGKEVFVCPVMGGKVASAKTAAGKSTYKGTTYYFCCAGCKPEFDKNPAKFVPGDKKAEAPKLKAVEQLACAVTGEKIASADKAAGKIERDGKTYHFCCGGCKSKFEADPEKYTAKASETDAHAGHNH